MNDIHREFLDIVTQVRTHLEYQAALGVRAVATSVPHSAPVETFPPAVVVGEGNLKAAVVFVSEAQRLEEDRQVSAFEGAAGQLLCDIIVKGMKLKCEDVYVCSIVGSSTPDELAACGPVLKKQIKAVGPGVIVALGDTAVRTLLGMDEGVNAIRGTWRASDGIPVMPTFDPAHLLKNPQDKKPAWEDIQKVMKKLQLVAGSS
ncbi:MAG TPA: uracil-DNA glycosylase [Nitrospirota bacterium]